MPNECSFPIIAVNLLQDNGGGNYTKRENSRQISNFLDLECRQRVVALIATATIGNHYLTLADISRNLVNICRCYRTHQVNGTVEVT